MRALIADHDAARAKAVTDACLARDLSVERAGHGAAALEKALERIPDVVICPIDLPVIDGIRLAEILRGNPRTRGASFVFLVHDELDAPISMDSRDSTVVAPWHEEEILDHIDAILERAARFGEIRSNSEIEGKLSQISIADLLQIFQMNARSGTLRISREGSSGSGSILVHRGNVVDASVPLVDGTVITGEKALYRILVWREGRFEFLPGEVASSGHIQKPVRMLLMEGMRQKDEWDKLRTELPGLDVRLCLAQPQEQIQTEDHPLTREVVDAIVSRGRLGEIVDHCSYPDYQVGRAVLDLIARGTVEIDVQRGSAETTPGADGSCILSASQVRRVREWVSAQRPRQGPVVKLLVASADARMARDFVDVLRRSADFVADLRVQQSERSGGLVSLGHFLLGDGLVLRLIHVPANEVYRPLWGVAAYGMLGAVVLPSGPFGTVLEATEGVLADLESIGASVVQLFQPALSGALSPEAREQLVHLGAGSVFVLPAGPSEAQLETLRRLFVRLLP